MCKGPSGVAERGCWVANLPGNGSRSHRTAATQSGRARPAAPPSGSRRQPAPAPVHHVCVCRVQTRVGGATPHAPPPGPAGRPHLASLCNARSNTCHLPHLPTRPTCPTCLRTLGSGFVKAPAPKVSSGNRLRRIRGGEGRGGVAGARPWGKQAGGGAGGQAGGEAGGQATRPLAGSTWRVQLGSMASSHADGACRKACTLQQGPRFLGRLERGGVLQHSVRSPGG